MTEVRLGDRRREARSIEIIDRLAAAPSASLPSAMGSEAMGEALYRHLSSEGVSFDALLSGHLKRTADRVAALPGTAYAIHDTTACTFSGESDRDGVGVVNGEKQGFFAHATLMVSNDGRRMPLGLLGCELWTRQGAKDLEECESARWGRGVDRATAAARDPAKLIHVADRESDMYELMAAMVEKRQRFIFRAKQDRVVELEDERRAYLFDAARETRQTTTWRCRSPRAEASAAGRSGGCIRTAPLARRG